MYIFHMLTVRGLPGSEGASASCMGLPGNMEAPLPTRLYYDDISYPLALPSQWPLEYLHIDAYSVGRVPGGHY